MRHLQRRPQTMGPVSTMLPATTDAKFSNLEVEFVNIISDR